MLPTLRVAGGWAVGYLLVKRRTEIRLSDYHAQSNLDEREWPLMLGVLADAMFQLTCVGLPPPWRDPPHSINVPECDGFPTACKCSVSDAAISHC